ncbi:MAG: tetratricopeptide repeat protein [Bacteroidota bacterium]
MLFIFGGKYVLNATNHQLDSLNHVIKTAKHDTLVANAYLGLVDVFFHDNFDTITYLSNTALAIAERNLQKKLTDTEKTAFLKIKVSALSNLGYMLDNAGNIKALDLYEQSLKIAEEIGDKKNMLELYNNIGLVYNDNGNIKLALDYYQKALKVNDDTVNTGRQVILLNIGYIYYAQNYMDKALQYYGEAYILAKKMNSTYSKAMIINNAGRVFFAQKQYDKAMRYYQKALLLFKECHDDTGIAIVEANIADIYSQQNKVDQALEFYLKSLEVYRGTNFGTGITTALTRIGTLYVRQKDTASALKYGLESMKTAEKNSDPLSIKEAATLLYSVYKQTGNYKKAFVMHQLYTTMRDSLNNEATRKTLLQMQFDNEYDIKDAKFKATAKAEKEKITLIYIISLAAIALIISVFIIVTNKNRQLKILKLKNEFEVETANTRLAVQQKLEDLRHQALNAAVNPHFIFNTLGAIQSFVMNKDSEIASDYIAKFAELIRITLNYAGEKYISIAEEVKRLNAYLELEKLRCGDKLTYHIQVDDAIDLQKKIPNMIIQPLVENAIIHGILKLDEKDTGLVDVTVFEENEFLTIQVKDNGAGYDRDVMSKHGYKSIGLPNLKERLSIIKDAEFSIQNRKQINAHESGTIASVKIPVDFYK